MTWRAAVAAIVLTVALTPTSARAQEQPHVCQIVDCAAVLRYVRALPPDQLIRIAWAGTGQEERALAIARRESGMRCNADNPRSSASGLFQHLSIHAPRAEQMGFTWAEVAGPDCYADVMLAFAMWQESGWAPWRL
jgi:hypothetical protein